MKLQQITTPPKLTPEAQNPQLQIPTLILDYDLVPVDCTPSKICLCGRADLELSNAGLIIRIPYVHYVGLIGQTLRDATDIAIINRISYKQIMS